MKCHGKEGSKHFPFYSFFCGPQFKAVEVLWFALVIKNAAGFEERLLAMELEISQVGKNSQLLNKRTGTLNIFLKIYPLVRPY